MIRLVVAVGFLAVFGFIAWALFTKITNQNKQNTNKDGKK